MSSKSGNPFLDDDEVDDFEFINHPRQGQSGYALSNDSNSERQDNWESRQRLLLDERRRIEDRTLQSTHSSLGILHETEQVGISTAEELVHQREQLQHIEKDLDTINSTFRISQKHINSMKSVFGGIKSYFSKGNTSDLSQNTKVVSPVQESGLKDTVNDLRSTQREFNMPHAALRVRGINYDDEDEGRIGRDTTDHLHTTASHTKNNVQSFDDKLDQNLEDIGMGLGRLKNLAIGLNEEIMDQNQMLNRIYDKADHADETVQHQNRQINRIIKK